MSNTSKGRAEKGSKFWMQMIPNKKILKNEFDKIIGEELEWLSPLEGEKKLYEEYELRSKKMVEELGITDISIFKFWPNKQPQWDGIALSRYERTKCGECKGKTLYLIEAKAHTDEMENEKSYACEESKKKIEDEMEKVQKKEYPLGTFETWKKGNYQLGNRLLFLHKMKEKLPKANTKGITDVKLVLINFTDDFTYKSEPVEVWKDHYKGVFENMTGSEETPEDVINIFYSVKPMGNQ